VSVGDRGRPEPEGPSLESLTLGSGLRLEDLVDRAALGEVCRSFFALFGIPVRIFAEGGTLLADAVADQAICGYVQGLREGRRACMATIGRVKAAEAAPAEPVTHPCFTGAVYRSISLDYDGRKLGRVILGPYLPAELREVPRSLLAIDPGVEPERARDLLPRMPRARTETIERITKHLQSVLDLILFSGHRALLTSQMHLASVRESYRALEERNAKLQESYERLKELDRLKSNFLATVSHELRTPLTSILGYGEMLAEGIAGPLQPEQAEFVGTIREKGEQLLALIKGLLDQSKLESGTLSLRIGSVQIGDLLRDVASTLLPAAKRKGVALEVVIGAALPPLRGDGERLRQVFLNLAENALKFTPQGGSIRLVAEVESGVERPEDDIGFVLFAARPTAIVARVEDTGIGIPVAERARIFEPFYQVDGSSTREHGGTGLGLSIVKRIVEMHGGTVSVDANPAMSEAGSVRGRGQGAVFTVRLPLDPK
jgi:signal transduction histidine kinase